MAQARRPTQRHAVSRSFGGRGFNDVVDERRHRPGDPINRFERASAFRSWRDAFYLFEEDEEKERHLTFRQQYAEYLIAAAVILFFVGSYTAFIVWLALTR
jgi:hypothetical protein